MNFIDYNDLGIFIGILKTSTNYKKHLLYGFYDSYYEYAKILGTNSTILVFNMYDDNEYYGKFVINKKTRKTIKKNINITDCDDVENPYNSINIFYKGNLYYFSDSIKSWSCLNLFTLNEYRNLKYKTIFGLLPNGKKVIKILNDNKDIQAVEFFQSFGIYNLFVFYTRVPSECHGEDEDGDEDTNMDLWIFDIQTKKLWYASNLKHSFGYSADLKDVKISSNGNKLSVRLHSEYPRIKNLDGTFDGTHTSFIMTLI